MKTNLRITNFWYSILLGIMLVFFNQACSMTHFTSIEDAFSSKTNNGYGYGGKLNYFHFIPEFSCNGNLKPESSIVIAEDTATYSENNQNNCAMVSTAVVPSQMIKSTVQNDVIAYAGDLYERKNVEDPQSVIVPPDIVEVWCSAETVQQKFEMVVRYDIKKELAVTTFYDHTITSSKTEISTEAGAVRNIAELEAFYRGDTYSLHIDKRTPWGIEIGAVTGVIQSDRLNGGLETPAKCYLGGSLDPRIWPAKILADNQVVQMGATVSQNKLIYIKRDPLSKSLGALWAVDFTTHKNSRLVEGSYTTDVSEFKISPNGQRVAFRSKSVTIVLGLFVLNLPTGGEIVGKGRSPLPSLEETSSEYWFSEDSTAIYSKGFPKSDASIYNAYIRRDSFEDDAIPSNFLPNAKVSNDFTYYSVLNFEPLKSVFYFYGPRNSVSNDFSINMYDIGSNTTSNVTPALSSGEFLDSQFLLQKMPSADDNFAFATKYSNLSNGPRSLYVMNSSGQLKLKLTYDGGVAFFSPNKKWLVLPPRESNTSVTFQFIDVTTLLVYQRTIPGNLALGFDSSEKNLVILDGNQKQITNYAITNSSSQVICQLSQFGNSIGQIFKTISIDDRIYYIIGSNADSSIKLLFEYSSTSGLCKQLNKYNSTPNSTVSQIFVSKNKSKMIVNEVSAGNSDASANSLYFIPTNGKPVFLLNNTVKSFAIDPLEFIVDPSEEFLYLKAINRANGNKTSLYQFPMPSTQEP